MLKSCDYMCTDGMPEEHFSPLGGVGVWRYVPAVRSSSAKDLPIRICLKSAGEAGVGVEI